MDFLWQIELLGGLRARGEHRTIDRFRTHKSAALLAYLAYHLERAHARDELVELLWPGSETAAGRLSLRVELASLRRQLEPPSASFGGRGTVLRATHAAVSLNPRVVTTDVTSFEAALRTAPSGEDPARRIDRLRRGVALYPGELLPGFFEEWVLPARLRLADRYLAALRELSRLLQAADDLESAIDAAHRAVAADRLSEEAHFDLIRLYAAAHRPADAYCQYEELEEILREQLGEEPDPEIRRFVADLAARGVTLAAPVTGPRSGVQITPAAAPPAASRPEALHAPEEEISRPRLPLTLTRFFGREAELAHLETLLSCRDEGRGMRDEEKTFPSHPSSLVPHPSRLVTLTGPPGCGKTRLAVEIGWRLSGSFSNAVWFVPLADLTDASGIPAALAEALRLPRSPDLEPFEQAAMILGRQPSLLILDNLEHLIEEGRGLVRQLLLRAPAMACLVTSRQPLELDGEQEIPLPPLPVPVDGQWLMVDGPTTASFSDPSTINDQPSTLMQCPSIQLFVDRAQAVRPDFQVTVRNAAAVAVLCARLEGIPLAIELAAAWARALTPAQIAGQLQCGSALLVSRRKDRPPRHQSLHAAIDWSYRLLDPVLQRFMAQLSIFQGGWEIEAAAAILDFGFWISDCELPARSTAPDDRASVSDPIQNPKSKIQNTLSLVAALRDRSLVVAEERGERMRYRMLESVREYARAQLSDGEWRELAGRHACHYRALAEEAEPHLGGPEQKRWAERLQADTANPEAALGYGEGSEDGLRLAAALCRFWQLRGQIREGGAWLARLLATDPGAPLAVRARAAFAAAALAYSSDDRARGEALCEEGLRLVDRLPGEDALATAIRPLVSPSLLRLDELGAQGTRPKLWEALGRSGDHPRAEAFLRGFEGRQALLRCDYAAAAALYEQSLARYRELGDRQGIAAVVHQQGVLAMGRGDYAAARRHWEEARSLYQELGDLHGVLHLTGGLAYVARWQADYSSAGRWLEEMLALSRQVGSPKGVADALWELGNLSCRRGEYDRAAALLEESLMIRRALGGASGVADSLSALGVLAHARGDWPRARALHDEALQMRRQREDRLDIALSLSQLGAVALAEGRLAEAARLCEESLALSHEIGSDRGAAPALLGLGLTARRQGDLPLAEQRLREGLAMLRRMGDRHTLAEGLEALAELRARQRREEEALGLYSAADALRGAIGAPVPPGERPRQTRALAALRAALGPERFAAIWEAAQGSDPDELLALVDGDALLPLAAEGEAR